MAPHDIRRPFKPAISDQHKRREISLQRQAQNRNDAHQARRLASSLLSFSNQNSEPEEIELIPQHDEIEESEHTATDFDILHSAKLRGAEARRWFARQLMLPEWMIDVPDRLNHDWYVFARPSGKRCFIVSSNGTTVSRLRNGSLLDCFPSALPNGAKARNSCQSRQSYCIIDCIFHELDQTYYVIDMVCWAGISFFECTAEFRFFWLNNKLVESGACNDQSLHHKYRFSMVSVYNCDHDGLNTAYTGPVSYVKDGLLFYNKHAHYQAGNTPLTLVWKDENCSQYVIDTDGKGRFQVNNRCPSITFGPPGVALGLQDDGKLITSDDPPVVLGIVDGDFIQKESLHSGNLLRFAVNEGGLTFVEGKLEKADLHYQGKVNRARAFADSYSKVMFQYMVRHSPIRIEHLLASICSSNGEESRTDDMEMVG